MSASTITPKQQSFIGSLLEERLDTLGITDLDAYIRDTGIDRLTAHSASKVIEHLKSIPATCKPEHSHLPQGRVIVNRYSKPCAKCGHLVGLSAGHAVQTANGWLTFHRINECVEGSAQTLIEVVPKHAYKCADGTVAIAYTTQNGRVAVRRLVIDEDGVGGLEYWQGGVSVVRSTGTLLTAEEASSLGKTYGFCICCGKSLSEDTSLAVGYGSTCAENNGWWYPTAKEARNILNRSTTVGGN
jgi:hypothetical protein